MKIQLHVGIVCMVFGLLFWACTNKEINLITNIDFEVSITNEQEGFVKDSLKTTIALTPEVTNYPGFVYTVAYKVTNGSGYFVAADQTKIKEDEAQIVTPLSLIHI